MLVTCVLAAAALAGCSDSDEPEDGDLPLVGTTWVVESYDLGEGTSQPPEGAAPMLVLHDDNTADLRLGCNDGTADFDAGAETISVRLIGWTEAGCEGDVLALEDALREFYAHDQLKWAVAEDLLVLELPESVGQDWIDLRGSAQPTR